jgi:hypothetical protein
MDRHKKTRQHEVNMVMIDQSLSDGFYKCAQCNYSTVYKGNFRKHLMSSTHRSKDVAKDPIVEVLDMFMKQFSKQHETTTEMLQNTNSQNTEMIKNIADRIILQQQQQPVTQMTLQQQQQQQQQQPQNVFVQNNTNSNNKFSLNIFLNEECKNAMNMNEFMQGLNVSLEDIKHLGEVGYTEGMSRIISKALRNTDTSERPMHCTDIKRETIYIRKDDAWHKDVELEDTKRLIQHITRKNYKALSEWRATLPEQLVHDTEEYETWYSMSRNMCNTDPKALNKLIRHLAMVIAVEKE